MSELIDGGITASWRIGAWSPTTGYPSAIAFHEERLCFAASPYQPNTVWMSVAGDYDNHAPTDLQSKVLDDNGINYTLASGKMNAIKWLNSGPTLIMGTFGDEWQVSASSIREAITPTNISVVRHTSFGSGNIRPIRIGSSVLFVQRAGRRMRELQYDFETDSLQAKDITIVSDHILKEGGCRAIAVAYQQEPNSLLWVVRSDGRLACLTYIREQDVYAWHIHEMGGNFQGGPAVVESIASISNGPGREDSLYVVVKRTINGETRRHIEILTEEIEPVSPSDKSNFNFLDASLTYSGAAATAIGGFSHLEGAEVHILADGSVRPPQTVTGGVITLAQAASKVTVGLPYVSTLTTMPLEGLNPFGPTVGKIRRIDHVGLRLLDSMGFKYGPNEQELIEYSFRGSTSPMDQSSQLYSDDVNLPQAMHYAMKASITIVQNNPYPLNILCLTGEGESSQ